MSVIMTLFGTAVLVYGLIMYKLSNFNLGIVLTVLLGALFLLWGIFYKRIKSFTQKGIPRILKILFIIFLCAESALVCFIALYGHNDNVDYSEDAVVVLGAGLRGDKVTLPLKMRLDSAVEYHEKNPDAVIVVSGGQGYQESVTEASAMEKYLISRGVDADVILKEEKATSTNENMRYSKEILDTHFDGGKYKTVIITNNFHIYRGVAIAKIEGFEEVFHKHAGLKWYNLVPCYLRESLAVLKMWFLG